MQPSARSANATTPATASENPWVGHVRPNPHARMRLFCFPYAGGGASIFRRWPANLPGSVEVCPIRLPGREGRLNEPAMTELTPLVEALGAGLLPYLDKPFAMFGHSMGAIIAFELARRLSRLQGLAPLHLFVSGRRAPHLPEMEPPTFALPDEEFVHSVRALNGTPSAVLDHFELLQIILPLLRADFSICQTYVYLPGTPLCCPITVFGGLEDTTTAREHLEGWCAHTSGPCVVRMFPGDHFFLHSCEALLFQVLSQELNRVAIGLSQPSPG